MVSERTDDETRLLVVAPDELRPTVEGTLRSSLRETVGDEPVTVSTAAEALETLADRRFDCVLTPHRLPDADLTGLDLLERIRERESECPVVLAPGEDGDESLAGEAVAAGVTEYVPGARSDDSLTAALERAIETGRDRRDRRERRERARQFSAIFDDPETYSWVATPDGRIRRTNETARESIAAGESEIRDHPLSELSWWSQFEDGESVIRDAIDRAADGNVAHRELVRGQTDGDDESATEPRTLEVTIRPVRNESGAVVSLLAQATDVTERARLEAELRESEALHRVTLNNMTDTVLITDDDGAFTYVCPNVNFIFGYSDDEIHEMGTIEDLLGPGLFDREELAEDGVLTNIECTATDKAGREHTLLVNVREVSIQGGTTLYSCRDITKRKRREEALTALHQTARELLYAETDREIANAVVEDATDVLDLEATAAYLFDTDENVLQPAARSSGLAELHGPLSPQRAGTRSIPGDVFVERESRFFANVRDSPRLSNPTTGLRSAAFVPLGDHGVFLAGSADEDAFDEVARELTDLLAATAEAALDRVERERTLRERDRELKRRNRQLTRLNRINEIIREIDQALVQAETREEIERAVCERLTTADRFSFAWIGSADTGGERLESRAHGGADRGQDYLDGVSLSLEGPATEPAVRTAIDREVTVVPNVVDGLHDREQSWRKEALTREYQSIISVPLSYDEFTYGVLAVYADRPEAFDEVTRTVLEELGETIASAIAAVERKSALLSDASTRLEFDVRDENFVFTRLARRADCAVSFDGGVRQHEDGASVFATVEGASPSDIATAAADLVTVEDVQVIRGEEGESDGDDEGNDDVDGNADGDDGEASTTGGTVLLELSRPFLALRLADHGVILRSVEATPEGADVVVDVPRSVDARGSADVVSTTFSDVELRSKRSVDRTTPRDLRSELLDRLTDRQLEVVQLAYYGGYFESPRERSGEEVAETLGISAAAFYRHNRTVQRKLLSLLFDELGVPANTTPMVE
ncbi:GAF domain-containing protein [Natronorubrum sp. JWXQ-INN-674]|uniref:GAF domain-containing protein n=1 Tax=Natronorubrum halalkaliphilum TaxID=2691917 RepID=A0A6B0VLV7_9EURY|nr:bacterio-opsin activator domain-containing protein [Natronorubrum halalkaliphilum]MXV61996.1 GAF domain-containing protein [Natronorubrum halalkaliphilum]